MRKPVNVIYQFSDVECTEAERDLRIGRFFMALLKLQIKQDKEKEDVPRCKIY